MSKARACKLLGYSPATVNDRLLDAGLKNLVGKPTQGATTKDFGKNEGALISKHSSKGNDSNRTFVADGNGGDTPAP